MNNEYYIGRLSALGIDYQGDDAHGYWLGRMDAIKCKSGNTPCGDICLPKGKKCKTGSGAKLKQGPMGAIGEAWSNNVFSDYEKGGRKRALKNAAIRVGTAYGAAGALVGAAHLANAAARKKAANDEMKTQKANEELKRKFEELRKKRGY